MQNSFQDWCSYVTFFSLVINFNLVVSLAAVAANNVDDHAPFDYRQAMDTYLSFMETCQTAVFQTQCTLDTDCPYSGSCSTFGQCAVEFSNPGPALFKCYVAKMKNDLRIELESKYSLGTSFPSVEAEANALASVLVPLASTNSCIGRTGFQFNGRMKNEKDQKGNSAPVFSAGDAVGCLLDRECNFNPWSRTTSARCTADNLPGFCAQCSGDFCNPVSVPAQCYLSPPPDPSFSLASPCAALNGTLRADDFNPNSQACYFDTARNSSSSCFGITGSLTCDPNRNDMFKCSQTVYFGPEINPGNCTNQNQGQQQQQQSIRKRWATTGGGSKCFYDISYNQYVQAGGPSSNITMVPGIIYRAGIFDTQGTCPEKTCNQRAAQIDMGNATQCTSTFYCTQPCSRCRSNRFPTGGCFNSSISTQPDCQSAGGRWEIANGNSQTGLCNLKAYSTGATCAAAGLTFLVFHHLSFCD